MCFCAAQSRDVDDQPAPPARPSPGGELARAVVRADAGAEHRVPAPERLLPERLAPGELAVLDHPLVAAPDVVHEDVDAAAFVEDVLERRVDLGVVAMVARMPVPVVEALAVRL